MIQNPSINSPTCSICLSQLENQIQVLSQCGHTFHSYCLTSEKFNTTICPICRAEIKQKKDIQILELAIPYQGKTQNDKNKLTIVYSNLKESELFFGRILNKQNDITIENEKAKIIKREKHKQFQSLQDQLKGFVSKYEYDEQGYKQKIIKTDEQIQYIQDQICKSWKGFSQIKQILNINFKVKNQRVKEKIRFLIAMQQYEIAWLKQQIQNQ